MRTSSVNNSWKKCTSHSQKNEDERRNSSHSRSLSPCLRSSEGKNKGKISVVGIGPGALEQITPKARKAIEDAEVIVGYRTYIELVQSLIKPGVETISGTMGREVERAATAVKCALEGKSVAVVSSGDPGVYGMAGVVLEVADREKADVPIEVVPGVTAATAAAAALGAPLVTDFAVISLSDLLTPWTLIEERLHAAAEADFAIVLYNPQSEGRKEPLTKACEILLKHRSFNTPIGIVKQMGREGEAVEVTKLGNLLNCEVDMVTTIVVGNSATRIINQKMVTPRGYIIGRK